jgi:AraC-like DNA-binding protein
MIAPQTTHWEIVMRQLPDIYYYLPVNDDAMRWGIYLTGVGRTVVPGGSVYPPYSHPRLYHFGWEQGRTLPEFQVVLISQGRGVFESQTGKLTVPPRSVFFLFPGVWHRYRPVEETGWIEHWIAFNGELAHRLMETSLLQRDVPIRRVADSAGLARCFDDLIEKVVAHPARNSILLSLHALGLLGTVIEAATGVELPSALEFSGQRDLTDDAVVSQALAWIWTRGHQAISVEQIAEAVGVTRRTLERRFQASVGHSIVDEIIGCRVNRAKRLLEETDMPVKAIAYLAGFPSEQRMRVAFVQRERLSPLKFRSHARRGHVEPNQ